MTHVCRLSWALTLPIRSSLAGPCSRTSHKYSSGFDKFPLGLAFFIHKTHCGMLQGATVELQAILPHGQHSGAGLYATVLSGFISVFCRLNAQIAHLVHINHTNTRLDAMLVRQTSTPMSSGPQSVLIATPTLRTSFLSCTGV